MESRVRLATFLHVSDLHIGLPSASGDARARDFWKYCHWLDGLLGHEFLALGFLARLITDLRETDEDVRVIATGDLTRVGNPAEFDLVDSFLGKTLSLGNGTAGLGDPTWKERAVCGNHDRWPGTSRIFGNPAVALRDTLKPWRTVLDPLPLNGGFTLQFIRLDTDAGVGPFSRKRFLANGSFVDEVKKLDDYFASSPIGPRELRVLLMHHSFAFDDGPTLVIDDKSRDALTRFIVRHGIAVILNGHTHAPNLTPHSFNHLGETIEVYEATCGTSAQRSSAPIGWFRDLDRDELPNTALVHRLLLIANHRLRWETQVFLQKKRGFVEAPQFRYSAPVFP